MPRSDFQMEPNSRPDTTCKEIQDQVLNFLRMPNQGVNALGEGQRLRTEYETHQCTRLGFPKFEDLGKR